MGQCAKTRSAYEAMEDMGFSREIVTPVLGNLLDLYGENWPLIEDQGYSMLVDAIIGAVIESEECKEDEKGKEKFHIRDAVLEDTPPAKRYKLRSETAQSSSQSDPSRGKGKEKMIELSDDSSDDDLETEQLAEDLSMFEVPIYTTPSGTEKTGFSTGDAAAEGYCSKLNESSEGKHMDTENRSSPCQSAKAGSPCGHASSQKEDFPDFKESNNGSAVCKLDLASSSKGEVTISITCHGSLAATLSNSDINAVMSLLEEKYAKIIPGFSMKKMLEDMCKCFLELGTISTDDDSFKAAAGVQSTHLPFKESNFQDVQSALVPLKESETRDVQSAPVPLKESDNKDVQSALVPIKESETHVQSALVPLKESDTKDAQSALARFKETDSQDVQSAFIPFTEAELRDILTESINKQHGFYISTNSISGATVQFENLYKVSPQIPYFGGLKYLDLSRCKIDLSMSGTSGEKGKKKDENEDCQSVS